MPDYRNAGDEVAGAGKSMLSTAKNAYKGTKAAIKGSKNAVKGAKAAATGAKTLVSVVGWKGILITFGVFLLISVLTVGTPSTSFNSFTHINEKQDPVTSEELNREIKDLSLASEAEAEAVNIIGEALKEEKAALYDRLKKEINQIKELDDIGISYEATLQNLDTNFADISSDSFNLEEGQWSDDTYDATCLLAAYSISVDNLFGETEIGDYEWVPESSEEAAEYVYGQLIKAGCTPEVACAILGNLQQESGIDPTKKQYNGGPGRGIAQWTVGGSRFNKLKRLAESKGTDWTSLAVQTEFLIKELNSQSAWVSTLKRCHGSNLPILYCERWGTSLTHDGMTVAKYKKLTNIKKATLLFQNHFEVADPAAFNKRLNYANTYYKKFAEGDTSATVYSSSSALNTVTNSAIDIGNVTYGKNGAKITTRNWRQDIKVKLETYLASDDGRDFYEITYDEDEDGNKIKYDGVIDKTEDNAGNVEDYKDSVKDDLVDVDSITDTENKGTSDSSVKQEAENKKEEKEKDPQLKSVKYVKATVQRKDIVAFAFEAFGVTKNDIARLYGEENRNNGEDIVNDMAMSSLALLHNVTDFEAGYVPPEVINADSYNIGDSLGAFNVTTYCLCNSKACTQHRKSVFGTNYLFAKSTTRRAGVSCASNTLPKNTIIYDEDFGILVVTEKLPAGGAPTIAIYCGNKHSTSKEIATNVNKILDKNKGGTDRKTFNIVSGITTGEALNYGNGISTGKFLWPLPKGAGTITSEYGPRWGRIHYGLDIGVPTGTPIFAADGGTVVAANSTDTWGGGYGLYVTIKHNDTYTTHYAHCSRIKVRNGQKVSKGQIIAYSGNTGRSTGPHLHFEIRVKGSAQDPLKFVKKQ